MVCDGWGWQGVAGLSSEGLEVVVKDIVSVGRRIAAGLAGLVAGQQQALDNARRASTEVSRRRVERDEVSIYLDGLETAQAESSAGEWPDEPAQAAD